MQKKNTPIATTINILISLIVIAGMALMILSIYHYVNKLMGFKYAKEAGDYAKSLVQKIKNGGGTFAEQKHHAEQLKSLVDHFNANLGADKIPLPSTIGPHTDFKLYASKIANAFDSLAHNEKTQHQFFEALVTMMRDKDQTLNNIQPITDHHVQFATSLLDFSKYVSFKELTSPLLKGTIDKKAVLITLLKGVWSWFVAQNGLFFIGGWITSLFASITLKIARKRKNLKGGTGLIISSILLPLFGYIFYPLLSLSYIFRKKEIKVK